MNEAVDYINAVVEGKRGNSSGCSGAAHPAEIPSMLYVMLLPDSIPLSTACDLNSCTSKTLVRDGLLTTAVWIQMESVHMSLCP